jgi:uncharacterized membrane protein
LWCAAIVAAPVFHLPVVYEFFSRICHQNPARSWFLFDEPLAVCIRCTSIYSGFLAALIVGVRPNASALRWAVIASAVEYVLALMVMDSVVLRALTGFVLGATAAPFVQIGVEQALEARSMTARFSRGLGVFHL